MPATRRQLWLLRPYLIGQPKPNGEWDMTCPTHEDSNRSASLNTLTGEWYCFAGCGGGRLADLIEDKPNWLPPGRAALNGGSPRSFKRYTDGEKEDLNEGKIMGWHSALMDDETIQEYLVERGIHTKTILDYEIGWDRNKHAYTIPVRGPDREIWNVRRYTTRPGARTKIWNATGNRPTELYPFVQINGSERIMICEGEWDTLATIQHGFSAVTRTTGVQTWQTRWNQHFKGKTVYVIQDRDVEGVRGANKIARYLSRVADVRIVELPYPVEPKHGKDLTDYWLEHDNSDFEALLSEARPYGEKQDSPENPQVITVLDSFDSGRVGDPIQLQVTVKGKKEPGYSIPHKAKLICSQDAGPKCKVCPLNEAGGEARIEIPPNNPKVLQLIDSSFAQAFEIMRIEYGALKCGKMEIEVEEYQAVEQLFARPSIDHADGVKARDYKNIKITSVGRHDTMSNTTIVATGALYPSPFGHQNEFLAWDVQQQMTSVDRFHITPEAINLMKRFTPHHSQRPIHKLREIERELASHVTRIIGRPEMHAVMDLTFHSPLSFKFGGQIVHRGWLESLIVGDTRTGKSEAAERLVRHYGAGEIVGGEAATIAGLVGGLQQLGGRDWAVTWGVIPLNDRRLVVIDELSGLQPEEIAKMSDVRASGVARLTKIQQEVTFARTRLLWLGNPRSGGMEQFTYGVDALVPLIGNPEDIARFDLAMAITKYDVDATDINRQREAGELRYTPDACHTLLMWAWTRLPENIVWTPGAEDRVYKLAIQLGMKYVEDPPLLQAANARIKIARLAIALAARTFSTDDTYERIVVTPRHVEDAVKFINILYNMKTLGYADRSREKIQDERDAHEQRDAIRTYLLERRGLAKLLRNASRFRRQDLEEVLNVDRDNANSIINRLYNARMIRKEGGADNIVEPTLHGLLREVRW